jgi:hypothetical protein
VVPNILKVSAALIFRIEIFNNKARHFHNPDNHNLNSHCHENLTSQSLATLKDSNHHHNKEIILTHISYMDIMFVLE